MIRPGARIETVMDPTAHRIASVYAEALLDLIPGEKAAQDAYETLTAIADLLVEVEGFDELLSRSMLTDAQCVEVVQRIFGGRLGEPLEGLLSVMAAHGRCGLLGVLPERFRQLLNLRQGKVEVTVITAQPMDEEMSERLGKSLKRALGAKPVVRRQIDPTLIGGMLLRIGDKVFDASAASRLSQIRQRLNERIARRTE